MKKNFFKKLASVLSLALVVTTVAPYAATSADAAAAPNLAKRYVNVYEGTSYSYAATNAKGYTVKWVVSGAGRSYASLTKATGNTTALRINTKGAAAAKNKAVVVTARFYKGNKLVRSAGDGVVIKVSAKSLAIKTAADTTKVPVGEATKFSRVITPANATSVTYWSVTDKDGAATTTATIDKSGNFTATAPGTYKIVAEAKNAANGKAVATATQEVTAVFKLKSAKLVATNKVELTLSNKVDGLAANDVTIVNTESKLKQPVKSISVSADGLTVTAETYSPFIDGKAYTITIKDSSTDLAVKIGKIASIAIEDQLIKESEATAIKYTVLDENGLDITSEYPLSKTGMQVILSKGALDSDYKLTLADKDSTFVTIKFNQYDSTGKDITVTSNQAKITAAKAVVASVNSWTIADSGKAEKDLNFASPTQTIAAKTSGKHIYIKYKNNINADKVSTASASDGITFTSLNTDVLVVDAKTGLLYPQKAGTADIKVEAGGNTIIYLSITITDEAKLTSLVVEPSTVTLSTALTPADSKVVTVKFKDQYNNDKAIDAKDVKVKVITGDTGIVGHGVGVTALTTAEATVAAGVSTTSATFTLTQIKKGSCTLLITVDGVSKVLPVTVAEVGTVAGYEVDLNRTVSDPFKNENVTLTVYAVDANKTKAYVAEDGKFTLKNAAGTVVKDSTGAEIKDIDLGATGSTTITVSTSDWELANGVYTVEVKQGTYTAKANFEVKTTRPGAALTVEKTSVDVTAATANVLAAVKKALIVKVDGNDETANITGVKFISNDAAVVATNDSSFDVGTFLVSAVDTKVTVRVQAVQVAVGGYTYTVDVNRDLTITVK